MCLTVFYVLVNVCECTCLNDCECQYTQVIVRGS